MTQSLNDATTQPHNDTVTEEEERESEPEVGRYGSVEKVLKQWDFLEGEKTTLAKRSKRTTARIEKLREQSRKNAARIKFLTEERKRLNRTRRAVMWVMRYVRGKGQIWTKKAIREEIDIQYKRDKRY